MSFQSEYVLPEKDCTQINSLPEFVNYKLYINTRCAVLKTIINTD